MKTAAIIVMMILPLMVFSQKPQKYTYRPAPQTGEWMCIAGVGMIALSAIVPKVSKNVGYIGGTMLSAGVVIDISGNKNTRRKSSKTKHRKFKIRF